MELVWFKLVGVIDMATIVLRIQVLNKFNNRYLI